MPVRFLGPGCTARLLRPGSIARLLCPGNVAATKLGLWILVPFRRYDSKVEE